MVPSQSYRAVSSSCSVNYTADSVPEFFYLQNKEFSKIDIPVNQMVITNPYRGFADYNLTLYACMTTDEENPISDLEL